MDMNILSISVLTILSLIGLQYWMEISIEKYETDGLTLDNFIYSENANRVSELLSGSYITLLLLATFALNAFMLIMLGLKTIFFSKLYTSEIRKMFGRLINYIIYKGTFLPLVVAPTVFQAGLWLTWLGMLCFLKMFEALSRDRLERLNSSPSVTPLAYFRVYSALLFVFSVDIFWIILCYSIYAATSSSMYLLLFFEPLSVAFETLQAIVVNGFQLLEIWLHHSKGDISNGRISKLFDVSPAGTMEEWKGILIRNLGFFLDIMTMLMALAHYVHIWWFHGMAFHVVDALLFLNIRALLIAIVKRAKSFIKLRKAFKKLHGALPDATTDELRAYDDECAICREPMAKAKKLPCKHLFHLTCLRSWLDQGLRENYSCPTCRKPLFTSRSGTSSSPGGTETSRDEQLARQISATINRPNLHGLNLPRGVVSNQTHSPETGDWRNVGSEPSWMGLDGADPSGISRVQMMMRQLAAVGETYGHTTLEDGSWNVVPPSSSSQASTSTSPPSVPPAVMRIDDRGSASGGTRSVSQSSDDNLAAIMEMAEAVREVLPHIPDYMIFEDLQQTNSATVTVNNLLMQM